MTKRIRCARNWCVEIQLAAIDQNEGSCGQNGFRETPPGHQRLRFWVLRCFSGDDSHHTKQPPKYMNREDPTRLIPRTTLLPMAMGKRRRHAKQGRRC